MDEKPTATSKLPIVLQQFEEKRRQFANGKRLFCVPELRTDLDTAVNPQGENTFIGFGINVIDGKDFIDAVRAPLLSDEVYGTESSLSIIDSSDYTKANYTATVRKELNDAYSSLDVSCKVETGKSVPFFSGGVSAMYGQKRQIKHESQFYRAVFAITTKKHILKGSYLFPDNLRVYVAPAILNAIDNPAISPDNLFAVLGTHMITSHSLGGAMNITGIFDTDEKHDSQEVEAALNVGSAWINASTKTGFTNKQQHISSQTEIRVSASGGNVSVIGGTTFETLLSCMKDWGQSIVNNQNQTLAEVYSYLPIWDFAADPERKATLKKAFWALAESRKGELSIYFTRAASPALPKTIVPGVNYYFRNKHADYFMDIFKGDAILQPAQIWTFNGSNTQKFKIILDPNDSEYFVICLPYTNMVLDIHDISARAGSPLWQNYRTGLPAQYFTQRQNNDGSISFLSKLNQTLAIDTETAAHYDGVKLNLGTFDENKLTQKWVPIAVV